MAAGAMQVVAPGARPLGQEEQHPQIKGCIQRPGLSFTAAWSHSQPPQI